MAFERLRATLRDLPRRAAKGIPAAGRAIKARYLADSVSGRGNTPYSPTDVQARADSLGVTVTAPEWSMAIARREGQPRTWLDLFGAAISRAVKGGA